MKKVLAIVLTLAMLLSCMIVGLSAVRVVTKNTTTDHAIDATGSLFSGIAYNDPINGVTSNYTLTIKVLSVVGEGANEGKLMDMNAFCAGSPLIQMGTGEGTIGFKDGPSTVAYTFAADTWYTVQYVVGTDSTEIFVNGTSAGTIAAAMEANFYGSWYRCKISEVTYAQDGTAFWSEDWEDASDLEFGDAAAILDVSTYTFDNQNVDYAVDHAIDATSSLFSGIAYNDPINGVTSNYTLTIKVLSVVGEGDKAGQLMDMAAFCNGSPLIKMGTGAGTIGFQGGPSAVDYTFAANTWYTVQYVVGTDSTEIFVNGTSVGTIAAAMEANFYGSWYRCKISEVTYAQDGNAFWSEDWEDASNLEFGDASAILDIEIESGRHDLGKMYGNAVGFCGDIKIGSSSKYESLGVGFSFDVHFATLSGAKITRAAYTTPVIDAEAGTIGVSDGNTTNTIPFTFEADRWYSMNFDASTNHGVSEGTDIYVDGNKIGHVALRITDHVCPIFYNLDIDNILGYYIKDGGSVYRQNECDFEDGTCDIGMYTNFNIYEYVMEAPSKTMDDWFTKGTYEGEATLIEANPFLTGTNDTTIYMDLQSCVPGTANVAYNFDISIIPNSTVKDAYVEIWTNTASRRWIVGTTYTGRQDNTTKDLTAFDWGTPSVTNHHNVTIGFYNGEGEIYVDGCKDPLYKGTAGTVWTTETLMMLWNCSVIVDNFQMMNTKTHEVIDSSFVLDTDEKDSRIINLDAEDFCATNGHITGVTTQTTAPTCYSLGTDTTVCAVCGVQDYTTDVPMIAHNWASYDINRTTEDGLAYTYCKNDGCTEKRYTSTPAAGTYTGTIYEAFDMRDNFLDVIGKWSSEIEYNGTAHFPVGCENNYNYYDVNSSDVKSNNWSWSFDFIMNSTFDTAGTDSYGHEVYFWVGGQDTIKVQAGYSADNNKLFIRPYDGTSFIAVDKDFTLVVGESYNIELKYKYDTAAQTAGVYLYINGVEQLKYDTFDDAIWNLPYADDKQNLKDADITLRDFGIEFTADNMILANADFARTDRVYGGDLDGDYALTAADALSMRKYLAKVITGEGLVTSRLDANNDSAVNAKDQLVIRKAIAGI